MVVWFGACFIVPFKTYNLVKLEDPRNAPSGIDCKLLKDKSLPEKYDKKSTKCIYFVSGTERHFILNIRNFVY